MSEQEAFFTLDAARIDWAQLRQQKLWLTARAAEGSDAAEGLLNFIDYVQDSTVEQHARTEAEVFAP